MSLVRQLNGIDEELHFKGAEDKEIKMREFQKYRKPACKRLD